MREFSRLLRRMVDELEYLRDWCIVVLYGVGLHVRGEGGGVVLVSRGAEDRVQYTPPGMVHATGRPSINSPALLACLLNRPAKLTRQKTMPQVISTISSAYTCAR